MQSRLEEEEEAKAALMSRIQRLTKLILVSSKNTIPGCLSDIPTHQRHFSVGEDDVSTFYWTKLQRKHGICCCHFYSFSEPSTLSLE